MKKQVVVSVNSCQPIEPGRYVEFKVLVAVDGVVDMIEASRVGASSGVPLLETVKGDDGEYRHEPTLDGAAVLEAMMEELVHEALEECARGLTFTGLPYRSKEMERFLVGTELTAAMGSASMWREMGKKAVLARLKAQGAFEDAPWGE